MTIGGIEDIVALAEAEGAEIRPTRIFSETLHAIQQGRLPCVKDLVRPI